MPPRTRKRPVSYNTEDEDTPAPKKTTRAPRKAPERPKKNVKAKESEAGKKKANFTEAKNQVQKQGDGLLAFIEQELSSDFLEPDTSMISKELTPDLSAVLPWMSASKDRTSRVPDTPPQIKATAALKDFDSILESYLTESKQSSGIKKPSWMRWEQDAKELGELNQHALGYATRAVNQIIMPGPHPSSIKAPVVGGDIQKMALELVDEGRPKSMEETWGTLAKAQIKAFSSILKLLPEEKASLG